MANDVTLEVLVDIKKAIQDLGKFQSESVKKVGAIEKAFGSLKTVAAAAVGVLAGREVVQFFSEGVAAAIAQEDALKRLEAQLDLTGGATQAALDDFTAFADQLEKTSKFEDDAALDALALAKAFGVTDEQAKKIVQTAADMAPILGDDLKNSVELLTKTANGNTKAFQALGINLNGLTKEQLANLEAVDLLAARYSGLAQRELETFSGAVNQSKKAFGNFQEAFGEVIINNPAVVAAIQGISEAFFLLEDFVKDNRQEIDAFVSFMAKVFVETFKFAYDAIYGVVLGFDLLLTGVQIAADGILDFIRNLGPLKKLPGFRSAIVDLAEGFAEFSAKASNNSSKLSDVLARGKVNIEKLGNAVYFADQRVTKSGNEAAKARKNFTREIGQSAKDVAKLSEEAKKFSDQIIINAASESEKLNIEFDKQIAQIREFEKEKVYSSTQANNLISLASEVHFKKLAELYQKDADEQAKKAKEAADKVVDEANKARERIEAISSDPIKFGIENSEIGKNLSEFGKTIGDGAKDGIAAGAGIANKALNGKDGAAQLISGAAGAFANSIIPGIGGVVSGIVSVMAQGPEATKKFIREFVDGIPDIIIAIADSVPVVIEALVDSLINEGGLIRIATAMIYAFSGASILKALFKQLGGATFSSFKEQWDKYWAEFGAKIKALFQPITDFFKNFKFKVPSIKVPKELTRVAEFFGGFGKPPGWLKKLEELLNWIQSLVNKLTGKGGGGVGIKIGNTSVTNKGATIGGKRLDGGGFTKWATGGVVPPGFPNDTFPARLTSGEMVTPASDVQRLSRFLDMAEKGAFSQAAPAGGGAMQVILQVGEKQLADVLVALNQRGFRTA